VVVIQLLLQRVSWKHSWLPLKMNQTITSHALHAFQFAGKTVTIKGYFKWTGKHFCKTYVKTMYINTVQNRYRGNTAISYLSHYAFSALVLHIM